jgi:biotin transporter BioY
MIAALEFIGLVVAFVVAAWARRKFKSIWAKVLFFFVAAIAGNLTYVTLGVAWALMNPETSHAVAREVGRDGWEVLGSTVGGALVGLLTSFADRFRTARKSN